MHIAIDVYYLQAIGIALAIVFTFSRNQKIDLFPLFAVGTWLIGVCIIYHIYGADQANFYSNDQEVHLRIVRLFIAQSGFDYRNIISFRYLITYPTYLFSKFGLDEILVLKSFQILSLLGIYFKTKSLLLSNDISLKLWHFIFIVSPLMFFFSLLALRDLTLALFAIYFIFNQKYQHKFLFLMLMFLLKPHLAIALIVGTFSIPLFKSLRSSYQITTTVIFCIFAYIFGSFSYSIGAYFKDNFFPGLPAEMFSQSKALQIFLNFSGLQFFSLINEKDSVVSTPTQFLLLARFLLFDTFVIPLSFIFIATFMLRKLRGETFLIFVSFIFYLGLVTQTDFNSTRQNIPFLAAMGIVSIVNIEAALRVRRKNLLLHS